MRIPLLILLLSLNLTSARAQDISQPASNGAASGGSNGRDEYSVRAGGVPAEDINPDANVRKRLVVDWGKVTRGYETYEYSERVNGQNTWVWKDDDSLSKGHSLRFRGKLLIESVDGKTQKPIDWRLGVRVVVSRQPDKTYDWSRRQEIYEVASGDCIIWKNGEFSVTISPGELQLTPGKEEQFQVALSLAEKRGARMTWTNAVGVLPRSVSKLSIMGPPPISKTMQIINGAPSYDQGDFNPAKLVRAVNHLMPMGKEKAIRKLRQFLKIAHGYDISSQTRRVDDNIDTSDRTCVFLIVRLLFERNEKLPEIGTVPFAPTPDEQDRKLWPLYPVYLQDDVPFILPYYGAIGGQPDQPERHLDWAEQHGIIRTKPLRPIDNPMLAAERLGSLPQTKRLYVTKFDPDFDFRDLLFKQAWNIIEAANPETRKPTPVPQANTWENPDWNARLKASAELDIHWSESEQRYIIK